GRWCPRPLSSPAHGQPLGGAGDRVRHPHIDGLSVPVRRLRRAAPRLRARAHLGTARLAHRPLHAAWRLLRAAERRRRPAPGRTPNGGGQPRAHGRGRPRDRRQPRLRRRRRRRLLSGIGAVLMNILLAKMVADWFAEREMSTAMAVMLTSWPVGLGVAAATLGGLATRSSWRMAIVATALAAALGL